jgi:hypothetical protein
MGAAQARKGGAGRPGSTDTEPPVEEVLPGIIFARGLRVFACACVLDVDRELARYVAWLLRAERRRIGTRRGTRLLIPFKQALFALAWLRDRSDVQRLGAGFGLSRSTAYRYPDEALRVLADQAPDLEEALDPAAARGYAHLILDGTAVATDRLTEPKISKKGREIDAWYSPERRTPSGASSRR